MDATGNMIPRVSVIVPNYNHERFLQSRIDSIMLQSFQDFELILLDDCSTDSSRDIIERNRNLPQVTHVVYNDTNSGSAFHQWAKGIGMARGTWIWIAESDDWADPSFLETMVTEAENHPDCGLVYSIPRFAYPNGHFWKDVTDGTTVAYRGADFAKLKLLHHNTIHNVSSIIFRRDVVLKADLSACGAMRLCGDWLLYSQLCRYTNVLEVSRCLTRYRIHDSNVSTRAEREGLPLIEGVDVLDCLVDTFHIPAKDYARDWGRSWVKQERSFCYDKETKNKISKKMRHYPLIRFWHDIYRLKIWQK